MLKLNNIFIPLDIKDIVETLSERLNIFHDQKMVDNNIMVTCPFHGGGNEHTPSMAILTENKKGVSSGHAFCFACHWSGSLTRLIEEHQGLPKGGGDRWLLSNFTVEAMTERELPTMSREYHQDEEKFVNPEFINKLPNYHQYLEKRGITPETATLYNLRYSPKKDAILFPVRNPKGQIMYIAERKVATKEFHIPHGVHKGLYGLYEALSISNGGELVLCEGVFDAMTSTQAGRPAVALLGTGSEEQINIIKNLPYREIVLALDGDEAGMKGMNRIAEQLRGLKIVSKVLIPDGEDVNSLGDKRFLACSEYYI